MAVSMRGGGTPETVAEIITQEITSSGISCELVDRGDRNFSGGKVILLVFEKYFMRSSNRASLSVIVVGDGASVTVDAVGAGGGQGVFFKFSWGAESSFESTLIRILEKEGFTEI